jgi:hypothetical protein
VPSGICPDLQFIGIHWHQVSHGVRAEPDGGGNICPHHIPFAKVGLCILILRVPGDTNQAGILTADILFDFKVVDHTFPQFKGMFRDGVVAEFDLYHINIAVVGNYGQAKYIGPRKDEVPIRGVVLDEFFLFLLSGCHRPYPKFGFINDFFDNIDVECIFEHIALSGARELDGGIFHFNAQPRSQELTIRIIL